MKTLSKSQIQNKRNFIKEFRELCEKHNVTIEFDGNENDFQVYFSGKFNKNGFAWAVDVFGSLQGDGT